jgi:DNA-binding response OmpR family regulator
MIFGERLAYSVRTAQQYMCRILIAEDDPAVRKLIELIARRHGHQAETAADGEEAIRKLRSRTYGVLVLDLMMPRVNGYDVIDFLRGLERRPAVIVVTAMESSRHLQFDPDIVTVLIRKPFDIELLGAVISETATEMHSPSEHETHRRPLSEWDEGEERLPS